MAIPLHISPRLVSSVASLYNDINRIFMEYIDNSLDNAELFYDRQTNSYKYPIEITLRVYGSHYRHGRVIIKDNCSGITNFTKVVQNIGDSDKRAQFWTNGQFGFGIYSFMAAAAKLEIWSKQRNQDCLYIPIEKERFQVAKQSDVSFPDPRVDSNFEYPSGTKIELSGFEKDKWKQIDIPALKEEIERHFELLLGRKNLKISLIGLGAEQYVCKAFDYRVYEGNEYTEQIDRLTLVTGKRYKKQEMIDLDNPVRIYVKVTKGKTINKSLVFIAKGRRIAEVKDVRLFKSDHKSDVWGHPNITGYIEVTDVLEPTIARNDFRNNDRSTALFQELREREKIILDLLDEENQRSDDKHYRALEDMLNQTLSKLARFDAMNFRTDVIPGSTVNLASGGGVVMEPGGGKDSGGEGPAGAGPGFGNGDGDGNHPGEMPGPLSGGDTDKDKGGNTEPENPFQDTGFKGSERKKSGFNIRLVDAEPPVDNATDTPHRSLLVGDEIRIFKKHPDFERRVYEKRTKEKKITERLITYIAGEITVHYKDRFYMRTGQPEYNINMFKSVTEFIYKFEDLLSGLVGKNLSDIS